MGNNAGKCYHNETHTVTLASKAGEVHKQLSKRLAQSISSFAVHVANSIGACCPVRNEKKP